MLFGAPTGGSKAWLNPPPLIMTLLMILLLQGCGPTENRKSLSGSVTWKDQPLGKGVITLYPIGDGDTVGCEIIDGKYSISKADGAKPGKYRVEIISFRPTGKTEFDVDQNKQVSIDEQVLPKKFNSASTLEAEIRDQEPNVIDFKLD